MKINLEKIPVKQIFTWYKNNDEEWVIWYNWNLNIRPKYQREFIYKDKQKTAVIETLKKWFPLNIMYWVKNSDWTYEVLDWQQRTISICEYLSNNFSINWTDWEILYFSNLTQSEQEEILNYELMIYFCEWSDKEKLEWFKTINIAWEKLTLQELRNAVYTWTWLTDAKKYISKTSCPAYNIASEYMTWTPIRQDYLETVLSWKSNDNIEEYMAQNQHNENASELWQYFQNVINWTKTNFIEYRKEMKWLNFWALYNDFKNTYFDAKKLEEEIKILMLDDEVTKKSWIYEYVLTRNEKFLNIRTFTDKQKREIYEKQAWICPICKKNFEINEMEADHITPWCEWWKTNIENWQMLCKEDNRRKSNK